MAKPKGSRKTGSRKKGTPNIMTRELKKICHQEAPMLGKELIRLATSAESEAIRVAAIKEMFEALAKVSHSEVVHPTAQHRVDQKDRPIHGLGSIPGGTRP